MIAPCLGLKVRNGISRDFKSAQFFGYIKITYLLSENQGCSLKFTFTTHLLNRKKWRDSQFGTAQEVLLEFIPVQTVMVQKSNRKYF